MDLLEKIQFNKVIHGAMAQLHSPLLSHQDIQNVQTSLNNLLVHCSNEQIVKQTHTLLQQLTLKSISLYFAEDTKYLNHYIGMVFSPIELVEYLTQKNDIGWGILSKNNNLWQIFLKADQSKNIEYSIWVDQLDDLNSWLDASFSDLEQNKTDNLVASKEQVSSDHSSSSAEPQNSSNQDDEFDQLLLSSSEPEASFQTEELPSFTVSQTAVNPFLAMKEQLNEEPAKDLDSHSEDESLSRLIKQQATAQLVDKDQLALTPELIEQIAAALAEKLKTIPNVNSSLNATHYADKSHNTTVSITEVPKAKPIKSAINYSFTLDSLVTDPEDASSPVPKGLTFDFSSSNPSTSITSQLPTVRQKQNLTTLNNTTLKNNTAEPQKAKEEAQVTTPFIKPQAVEAWDCDFELGSELETTFYYIKPKQQFSYLNLIALNTDMSMIQHQPIYMVEVIDEYNQFKYYTVVFGAKSNEQAIDLLNQLAHHYHDYLAHVIQITWREFKKHETDLSLCCQLYHTSSVILKSKSLYSHISESLISKQQMLYIAEVDADKDTPLLLLQENNRFRIIHGQKRLNMETALDMYPCLILSRSSGVTWQLIREQLKFLPEQVNVYQLFEALQHSATALE